MIITIRDIQEDFENRIRSTYIGNRSKYEPTSHWASLIGHECPFFLWAHWKHWKEWPPPSEYLMGIFAQGKDGEALVKRDLIDAGYQFTHQEIAYRDNELRVSGKIDGRLEDENIRRFVQSQIPYQLPRNWGLITEIKNVNEQSYDEMIGGFVWMFNSMRPWVRKYPPQTLAYGKLEGEPYVGMIIRCKQNRQTTLLIERVADYEPQMQKCRQRLMYVNECLDNDRTPEPIEWDHGWCHRCDAQNFCPHTGKLRGKGIEMFGAEMSKRVRKWNKIIEETKPYMARHNAAKKELRAMLDDCKRTPKDKAKNQSIITGGDGIVIEAKSDSRGAVRIGITDLKKGDTE